MDTLCGCAYVSIYYFFQEGTALFPFLDLLIYNWLIDNVFVAFVVLLNTDHAYTDFGAPMNDVGLTGNFLECASEAPKPSILFLDFTVELTASGNFDIPRMLYDFGLTGKLHPGSSLLEILHPSLQL